MYKNILVPVDGSDTSLAGVQEAASLAAAQKSQLRIFHVVNEAVLVAGEVPLYFHSSLDALRENGRSVLKQAAAVAEKMGVDAQTVLVENMGMSAATFILEQAKSWPADLIVMGTHGRRGLRRLVLGSDAELVVRSSPVPVLLVRGTQGES